MYDLSRFAIEGKPSVEEVLLVCPVRGPLGASALAADGMTPTEEARRVDFLHFLIDERHYPREHIRVEVVTVKHLGESGRNQLRADVIVYDCPAETVVTQTWQKQLTHAILVAEIKRDASRKQRGISQQLKPALMILPRLDTLGVYWDDENRILFTKSVVTQDGHDEICVTLDSVANLPSYGISYRAKAISVDTLTKPTNLVATLQSLANIMRSHGVHDEETRYRETVKLLLARYVDEKRARGSDNQQLQMQVIPGEDPAFWSRVRRLYADASVRYQRVQTLFAPQSDPGLTEAAVRDLVAAIQGFELSSASSDTMQQVFMTFVPVVFKKTLSQYFTPVSLIDTMVAMVAPGPTEKIADPAMGTGDFLTSALNYCVKRGDDDAFQRIYGADSDASAFDLAVVNMILNQDGQANLLLHDSIENHATWLGEMDVVLCIPPFGARTIEKRPSILRAYELGHQWVHNDADGTWQSTDRVARSQQLGILFIEKCWKMLRPGGRLAIIVPEGYLSTKAYGYVRQWILEHFVIRSLVELPRRIFVKSNADLRSNILLAEKRVAGTIVEEYPIHASMVRRVGYKLGGDFAPVPLRSRATGLPIRDDDNRIVLDSDLPRVLREFIEVPSRVTPEWNGATVADIASRADLDMKPRRLVPRALENIQMLKADGAMRLGDVASVLEEKIDLLNDVGADRRRRVVEGRHIQAIEGLVKPDFPERCWAIAERKHRKVYRLMSEDVIVGVVRPERRNVGILLDESDDIVGSPDGLAVVRSRPGNDDEYPIEWLFAALRSEEIRLQFWTEAGGTSYGKLTPRQVGRVLIPVRTKDERQAIARTVRIWIDMAREYSSAWSQIGTPRDRFPIINSPLYGLLESEQGQQAL